MPKKVKPKATTSADPTKGLGAILLGVHTPDERDVPLPFPADEEGQR